VPTSADVKGPMCDRCARRRTKGAPTCSACLEKDRWKKEFRTNNAGREKPRDLDERIARMQVLAECKMTLTLELPMSASNWVHLESCNVKRVTDKAMLVEYQDAEVWLPLSQVSEADQYEEGDTDVTISVTEWIAAQKDLEA
jgi:hypothetical protein